MTTLVLHRTPATPLPRVSVIQIDLMRQTQETRGLSWTFAPAMVRHQVYDLVHVHRLCAIAPRTFDGDTRVYEFVVLTPRGEAMLDHAE